MLITSDRVCKLLLGLTTVIVLEENWFQKFTTDMLASMNDCYERRVLSNEFVTFLICFTMVNKA